MCLLLCCVSLGSGLRVDAVLWCGALQAQQVARVGPAGAVYEPAACPPYAALHTLQVYMRHTPSSVARLAPLPGFSPVTFFAVLPQRFFFTSPP